MEEKLCGSKLIRTTLGDLIVAVTDEVVPIVGDPSGLYRVVSWILSDLLAHRQVHVPKRLQRKYPSYFAEGLAQEK